MAIAMGDQNAKQNAFNRIVDNWKFDSAVQGLQDLGEQGQVTAEMLDDPQYTEFIDKLVQLGVIDSAQNLNDIALAFNKVVTATNNANVSSGIFDIFNYKEDIDKLKEKYDYHK